MSDFGTNHLDRAVETYRTSSPYKPDNRLEQFIGFMDTASKNLAIAGLGCVALATELHGTRLELPLLTGGIFAELLSYNFGKSFTGNADIPTNQVNATAGTKE